MGDCIIQTDYCGLKRKPRTVPGSSGGVGIKNSVYLIRKGMLLLPALK